MFLILKNNVKRLIFFLLIVIIFGSCLSQAIDYYENISPYDPSTYNNLHQPINSLTPAPFVHSDSRCNIMRNTKLEHHALLTETVETRFGKFFGRIAFLCDSPNFKLNEVSLDPNGFSKSSENNVTVFFGIPYAKPPLAENELRFKPPQPPKAVPHVNGFFFKPSCPQPAKFAGYKNMIYTMNEDCLYLNIYTPRVSKNFSKLYPVMIYIHDGNFLYGTGNAFPGHMLAAFEKVVVITFNYRLGILGFFATDDKASPGNFGLLDQVQLIQWVRDNIRNFGGDPDMITLFGPGAGAASAGLLAISPLTRKYIKRVIASGGSALAPWAVMKNPVEVKNLIHINAAALGCVRPNTYSLVQCLNSRSSSEIPGSKLNMDNTWLPFTPVLDAHTRSKEYQFLPKTPKEILEEWQSKSDKHFDAYLTGVTRDEGLAIVLKNDNLKKKDYIISNEDFENEIKKFKRIFNVTQNSMAFESALRFMYSPWLDPTNQTQIRQGLIDIFSDSWYVAGMDEMVKLLLKTHIKTYMYVMNYSIEGIKDNKFDGITHDSEYYLVSGAPFLDPMFFPKSRLNNIKWTQNDRDMSYFFMKSWANFAKYGDPTPRDINKIIWKPASLNSLDYLLISNISTMNKNYRQKYCRFWFEYLPSLALNSDSLNIRPPHVQPIEDELRLYRASAWAIVVLLIILLFMSILCSCLYCRAKSDRIGNAALDYNMPEAFGLSSQFSAPSTRANSELSLSSRNRLDYIQSYKLVPHNSQDKVKKVENLIKTQSSNRHTQV